MRGILLLNGTPYTGAIDDKNAVVCCCDGAYEWAHGRVRIDKNIGDFDSLGYIPVPAPERVYPSEKNFTDGEIGIAELLRCGATEIEIYGAFGGRADHFLGNLHLLLLAERGGAHCKMISEECEIILFCGDIQLNGLKGKTVSVLPFGGALHIMESSGLKYSYPESMGYGECRGISNVVLSDSAFARFGEGEYGLAIINRGRV